MSEYTIFGYGNQLNRNDTDPFTGEKMKIVLQCHNLLRKSSTTVMELSRLIAHQVLTAIAVLPAPLQYQANQQQEILEFQEAGDYNSVCESVEAKSALD